LKEEALDRTLWRNRFRGGFGPVVRQNTEWMNEWMYHFLGDPNRLPENTLLILTLLLRQYIRRIYVFSYNFVGLWIKYEVISWDESILEHRYHIGMYQSEGIPKHVHC